MSALQKKLDSMIGKSFMYHTIVYHFSDYKWDQDGTMKIYTDKEPIIIKTSDIEKRLEDFLPVAIKRKRSNVSDVQIGDLVLYDQIKADLPSLVGIIKDNITKLRSDKEFISQAAAINESINSLINLTKLEIMVKKLRG